ncbi:formate-dependent phosphoribosylglycinamide formyltransferase [Prochlorococcus marinus]|uniref:formate-dependent phosphoribosylglycinamide formyltransferase n=1 Tax=Prochlorococcus marinus TaxID=1219 RepID=UPI0022B3D9E0|nr:formate-dependent phosphoribosylglycinamide formyltransferase [Prochlorococcus marinus]
MNVFPKKIMLLGSGELGKEVAIAAKRLGCYVIACDRYNDAPAMQIADQFEVLNMNNGSELKEVIYKCNPDIIIPEIEALAVDVLKEIEQKITVIPNARATAITMNRDKIRDLAANELNIRTAKFSYAMNQSELNFCADAIGYPLLIKPVMSSSGKGQSLVNNKNDLVQAWDLAIEKSRGKSNKIILEEFIDFDLEITLLTIRQFNGKTLFCEPIGHEQKNGDYQCSWQPATLTESVLDKAQKIAKCVTDNLGGVGLFGVEFFIKGEEVIFSELSPRPHDTGLVTLISQNLNEFELHLRAVLGIPIPEIVCHEASASRVILASQKTSNIAFTGLEDALSQPNTGVFIFGKPSSTEGRRMGVAVANAETIDEAKIKADQAAQSVQFINE